MPYEQLVGIHLEKASDLARALGFAASVADGLAAAVRAVLVETGGDTTLVRPILEASAWCIDEGHRLRATIDAVRAWEAAGRPPGGPGAVVFGAPYDPAFAAPVAAFRAAQSAIAAIEAGDTETFSELLGAWADNAVFAATLLARIDADFVVGALGELGGLLASPPGDVERVQSEQLVAGLAHAIAAASTADLLAFDFRALVDAAERESVPLKSLALLFRSGAHFDTSLLVQAVDGLVVELNRLTLETGGSSEVALLADGTGVLDARVLVLTSVAADRVASVEVVRHVDLDRLAVAELDYLDRGDALGSVVVAGTSPDGGAEAAAAALRFISWVTPDRAIAPGVLDRLGEVAEPYLGSFRSRLLASGSGSPVADPLPRLSEEDAREFVAATARSHTASRDLAAALGRWLDQQLGLLLEPDPAALTTIGSVYRIIGDGSRVEGELEASALDARRRSAHDGVDHAASLLSALSQTFLGSQVVPNVGRSAVEAQLPPSDLVARYLASQPTAVAAETEMLEYAYLDRLWRDRDRDHASAFAVAPPPPGDLLDPSGVLVPLLAMTEEQLVHYRAWRFDPALMAATHVGDLGDAHGLAAPPG